MYYVAFEKKKPTSLTYIAHNARASKDTHKDILVAKVINLDKNVF